MSAVAKIEELAKLFAGVCDAIKTIEFEEIPADVLKKSENLSRFTSGQADIQIRAIRDRNIKKFEDATKKVASEDEVDKIIEWLTDFIHKSVSEKELVSLDESIYDLVETKFLTFRESAPHYEYWSELYRNSWFFKLSDIKIDKISPHNFFVSSYKNYAYGKDPFSILSIKISDRLKQLKINEEMDRLGLMGFRKLVDSYFQIFDTPLTMDAKYNEQSQDMILMGIVANILSEIDKVLQDKSLQDKSLQDKSLQLLQMPILKRKVELMKSYISNNPSFIKDKDTLVNYEKFPGSMKSIFEKLDTREKDYDTHKTAIDNITNGSKAKYLIGGRKKTKAKAKIKTKTKTKRTRKTRRIR